MVEPPKKNSQLLVRLAEEDHVELKKLAASTGVKPATLATMAIQALVSYAEAHGGRLTLPLDFTRQFAEVREQLRIAEPPAEYRSEKTKVSGDRESGSEPPN